MKTIVKIPEEKLLYTCFPPIVSNKDRRISGGIETTPAWLTPIKEGKMINDIVYAVNDPGFWTSVIVSNPREEVRAQLLGYNLFSNSDFMLPYLLVEDKQHGSGSKYAKAYITLIAASILYQRLKLRAIGKMHTTLSCPELIVYCIVMVGSKAYYIHVGLRGPHQDRPAGIDDLYFLRYQSEVHGVFQLSRWGARNQFKSLLRMIHAFGIGPHHEMQKLEVKNALKPLISMEDGHENDVDTDSIMSVDTAFHCVPVEGQKGEYVLQYTDMTANRQKRDDLVPDEPKDDFEDNFEDDFENDFEDGMNQEPEENPRKRKAITKEKALAIPKKALKKAEQEEGEVEEAPPAPMRRTRQPKRHINYKV